MPPAPLTAAGWADVHHGQRGVLDVTAPSPHSPVLMLRGEDAAATAGAQGVGCGAEAHWGPEAGPLGSPSSGESFTTYRTKI